MLILDEHDNMRYSRPFSQDPSPKEDREAEIPISASCKPSCASSGDRQRMHPSECEFSQ